MEETLTGRKRYAENDSNSVSHVYIVDAIIPVTPAITM